MDEPQPSTEHESGAAPGRPQHRSELAGMDYGMRVLSYLIAGILCYGGLGWLGDNYFGTHFLLPIGIVLGAAGGCYVIIRRYGRVLEKTTGVTGRKFSRGGRRPANPWQSYKKESIQ